MSDDAPVVARLPDYRADPAFAGLSDTNPFHDPNRPVMRPKANGPKKKPKAKVQAEPDLLQDAPLPPDALLKSLREVVDAASDIKV